jgi:2-oxoglutarate dehydrogenase E2 component (dihydrolipoamide succinyltransferase)
MARVDVIMPQMGESIAEGTVSRWMKRPGDAVKRDEPILEISTDKVDAEIPSPAGGVLAEIKVPEGQTVAVQTVVAVIETDGVVAGSATSPPPADRRAGEPEDRNAARPAAPDVPVGSAPIPATTAAMDAGTPSSPSAGPPVRRFAEGGGAESGDDRLRHRSTPLVRRIAAQHGVDISRIAGTGHAGRVTKKDILEYVEGGGGAAAAATGTAADRAPAGSPAAEGGNGLAGAAAGVAGAGAGAIAHPTVQPWAGDEVIAMSRIRKLTADHMVLSRRVSAHVTSFYEVDFTRVRGLRERVKNAYRERGANPTYLTFIIKVIADNLRKHRIVNSSVSGDSIIYRRPINIGVAVALDWGLIVPVLRNADELSLLGIAKQVADLAERARTKRLSPEEVQQGTFTITNPGVFGSYIGAPIINQPQVAILGIGSIEKRPKVLTLEDGQDVIAIRPLGMLSLTYDHRVVDGADADRFMADVKRDLEGFSDAGV